MLARKRVRVATRAWWRAGWQWWCPPCYDDGNASRALYSASASKLRLLVKAMRLVSCRHIVEAVVLNVAVVVASSSLAASNRQRLAHQQLLHSKIKRPLRFLQQYTYTLVAPTTEFSFSCQGYFRRGVFSVCYFSPEKNLQNQKNRAYLCEESGVVTSDLQRQKTQPLFLPPLQPVYWKPGMPTAGKLVIYVARGNVKSESRLSKMEYHFNLNIRSSGKSSASKSKVKPCTLFTLQKKKG